MKKYRWNAKKCVANLAVLLMILGTNALVFWMLARWVLLGGAA